MIDAKTASEKAREYLKSFFPGAKEVEVEEVERSWPPKIPPEIRARLVEEDTKEGEEYWFVTLSFVPQGELSPLPGFRALKHYKTFKIDAGSGDVVAMKIREVG